MTERQPAVGIDATPLATGHATRGIGRMVGPANSLPLALPRPRIVTIHDTTFMTSGTHDRGYTRYARVVYGPAGRHADAVLAPSETTRSRLIEDLGIPAARIRVVYPGLDHLISVAPAGRDPATPAAMY